MQEVAKAQISTENLFVQADITKSLHRVAIAQLLRAQVELVILQLATEGPEAAIATLRGTVKSTADPLPLSNLEQTVAVFRQAVTDFLGTSEKVRMCNKSRELLSQAVAHVMHDYYDQLGDYNSMQSGGGHGKDPQYFLTAPRQKNVPADFKLAITQTLSDTTRGRINIAHHIHRMPVIDQQEHQRLRELEPTERFANAKCINRATNEKIISKEFHLAAHSILGGSMRHSILADKGDAALKQLAARLLPAYVGSVRFTGWKQSSKLTRWNMRQLVTHFRSTLAEEQRFDEQAAAKKQRKQQQKT